MGITARPSPGACAPLWGGMNVGGGSQGHLLTLAVLPSGPHPYQQTQLC